VLPIIPFHFSCAGLFGMEFGVLDVLKDQQEGSSTDGIGILHQIILCLPLGWTHAQHVNCKVSVVQGQYLLGDLISLWAVVQTW
jgi:hypothetical protein